MARKGENIFKRKDGRWEGRYIQGRDDEGKAVYGYVFGRTYAEAKRKKQVAIAELFETSQASSYSSASLASQALRFSEAKVVKTDKAVKTSREQQMFSTQSASSKSSKLSSAPSLKEIAFQWLDGLKTTRKKSTVTKYDRQLKNYILPEFGDKKINEINNQALLKFSKTLLTKHGISGKKLAPRTVTDILSRMRSISKFAMLQGYEVKYVVSSVDVPQKREQIRVLSLEEQKKLIEYFKATVFKINGNNAHNGKNGKQSLQQRKVVDFTVLGLTLALFTGLRLGELCALKWSDISLEEGELHVARTMQRIPNLSAGVASAVSATNITTESKTVIDVGEPKSQSSIRTIPIPEILMSYLRSAYVSDTYVLSGQKHYFIEPRTMENRFKSVLKKCGIKDANFHALRHSFATRSIELGVDIKSLSEILGHSNVNITLNRYVHPSMKMKHENMNKLNELLA